MEPITFPNVYELNYLENNVLQDFIEGNKEKLDTPAVVHCGKYYLTAYKDGRSGIRKIDSLMNYPENN
jgi:hypothetical protein